jgi:hypothetical protein
MAPPPRGTVDRGPLCSPQGRLEGPERRALFRAEWKSAGHFLFSEVLADNRPTGGLAGCHKQNLHFP